MVVVSSTHTVIFNRNVTMFLIFLQGKDFLFKLFSKFRPVFKLILFYPQLFLVLSILVNLDITVGNQWNEAVAEESYGESDEERID